MDDIKRKAQDSGKARPVWLSWIRKRLLGGEVRVIKQGPEHIELLDFILSDESYCKKNTTRIKNLLHCSKIILFFSLGNTFTQTSKSIFLIYPSREFLCIYNAIHVFPFLFI